MSVRLTPRVALTAVVLLSSAVAVGAQSGRMAGKVVDGKGQSVEGAAILLELMSVSASADDFSARTVERGKQWQARTNENGDYVFLTLPSGRYVVTASQDGVGTAETRAVLALGGFATVNLTLRTTAPAADVPCAPKTALEPSTGAVMPRTGDSPQLVRLLRWLEAVEQHGPGCTDAAVTEVGSWPRPDLDAVLGNVERLATFLQHADEVETRDPVASQESQANAAAGRAGRHKSGADRDSTIELGDRSFTLIEVRKIFHGNDTLKRGAVLHADIAAFVRDDFSRRSVFVQDGQQNGVGGGTGHWGVGRRLLDSVVPSPGEDSDALLWYRAASAYLFREGILSELPAHLYRARRLFAGSAVFLVDSAYLHQKFASPAIQSAVPELLASGIEVAVESRRVELQRAEQFLRQALTLIPEDADVRLRFGHTLGELGRHDLAAAELRRALDGARGRQQRYLAALFLGREEQALGRLDEALRRFENAVALYPDAQSPWIALGHLARQRGDRAGALRALQRVTVRRSSSVDENDPRWFYYDPHLNDSDALMDQMRTIGRRGDR